MGEHIENGSRQCDRCGCYHLADEVVPVEPPNDGGPREWWCIECVGHTAESERRRGKRDRAAARAAESDPGIPWVAPPGFDPAQLEGRDDHGVPLIITGKRIAPPDPVSPIRRPTPQTPGRKRRIDVRDRFGRGGRR